VSEDAEARLVVYLGERIDGLRETMGESITQVHVRLNAMPGDIERAIARAVAPLIPEPLRWWQQHPWDKMLIVAVAWVFMMATGAAVTAGMMPEGLMKRLLTVAGSYAEAESGSESAGGGLARGLSEAVMGGPAEAATGNP